MSQFEPRRCVVVGCGGIGSWLADGLARLLQFQAPMSQLVLVDGDNFEQKNAERQNFKTYGNKADALRTDLQPQVPATFLISKPAWVVSEEAYHAPAEDDDEDAAGKITPAQLLNEHDVVFVTVDNHSARKLLFDAAGNYTNIDIFTGGNDDRLFGTIYHYQRRNGQDITHHPAHFHDEFINPPDRNPGELSCQERAMLEGGGQLLAVNMAVASWLLAKASHLLFGTEEEREAVVESSAIYFDLEVGVAQPRDRRCVDASVLVSNS